MKKRGIYLVTALCLAAVMCITQSMSGFAAPLEANEDGSVKGSCSLIVHPEDPNKKEEDKFGEDLASANVVVDLYQIAKAVKTPGYDTYQFQAVDGYTGLNLPNSGQDDNKPEESWDEIAQKAAEIALNPDSPKTAIEGKTKPAGEKIEALDPGLYLLVARGKDLTELKDYRIEMKPEDSTDEKEPKRIATIANSNQYSYAFLPQLVALPTKDADENGAINTANPTDWISDASVNLKPERKDRYGSLEIVKTLSEYETMEGIEESATFVFEVTGRKDGEVVYSNTDSITFTAAGQESVVLDRIPVGAEVTVTEVYSGSSYKLTTSGDRKAVIEAEEVVSVEFENEYDGRRTNGHGIKNHFRYDEEQGKWHWYSIPAQDAEGNEGEPPAITEGAGGNEGTGGAE